MQNTAQYTTDLIAHGPSIDAPFFVLSAVTKDSKKKSKKKLAARKRV